MALLAYNKTTGALNLGVAVLPLSTATVTPGTRGKAFDLTSQLRPNLTVDPVNGTTNGLSPAQFASVDAFRAAGNVDFEWTSDPEYATPGLLVDGPTPGFHAASHLPSGYDPIATAAPVSTANVANAAGTANAFAKADHKHAHVLASYTSATRPAATSVAVGTAIFNTDEAAPQYSDGSVWRDAAGNIT